MPVDKNFTKKAINKLSAISDKSRELNVKSEKKHNAILLDFIREHADEVSRLYLKGDKHFLVETGDLIVLCLELLIENGKDPDEILNLCFKRFNRKLDVL